MRALSKIFNKAILIALVVGFNLANISYANGANIQEKINILWNKIKSVAPALLLPYAGSNFARLDADIRLKILQSLFPIEIASGLKSQCLDVVTGISPDSGWYDELTPARNRALKLRAEALCEAKKLKYFSHNASVPVSASEEECKKIDPIFNNIAMGYAYSGSTLGPSAYKTTYTSILCE